MIGSYVLFTQKGAGAMSNKPLEPGARRRSGAEAPSRRSSPATHARARLSPQGLA
jgi:hypothetical protein